MIVKIDSTLAYLLKPSSTSRARVEGAPTAHEAAGAEATPDHSTFSPTDEVDFSAEAKSAVADAVEQLTEAEQQQVRALQERDAEVRAHEQAHLSAAGGHARGGPSYQFKTGPDGRQYAVGGEVPIDVSEVPGDPAATIAKAQAIAAAAHAPTSPSAADRAVAAQANRLQAEARQDLIDEQTAEALAKTEESQGSSAVAQAEESDATQNPQTGETLQPQSNTDDDAVSAAITRTSTYAQRSQEPHSSFQQQIIDAYRVIIPEGQLDFLA